MIRLTVLEIFNFKKDLLFILFERQRVKGKSSVQWFTSQMPATAKLVLAEARSQALRLDLSGVCIATLTAFHGVLNKKLESQLEQKLKSGTQLWDVAS